MCKKMVLTGVFFAVACTAPAYADDSAQSVQEAFAKGKVSGSLKSFYYAETYDTDSKEDAGIWVNGGNLKYETGNFYGLKLGGEFQAAFVGAKDDDSEVMKGSMDADGAVLSEAYLQYAYLNTDFKGGRQHISTPLIADSGSRMIRESFEGYFLTNEDLPGTTISVGWVNKYQTRTDQTSYADNWFVDYETDGDGDPGDFYDVGDDGLWSFYLKNTSLKDTEFQLQYTDIPDAVAGLYTDVKYTLSALSFKPYLAGQYYYTSYDDPVDEELDYGDNYLFGFKAGVSIQAVDLFAAYTSAGGSSGDARVYRGLGQGAYSQFTSTTKTAGAGAFEAGTDAYQVGVGYHYEKMFKAMLRYTSFDNPADNADLDEYTLNLSYNFPGMFENLSVACDYSILDYENGEKDATDLRTRLIYAF